MRPSLIFSFVFSVLLSIGHAAAEPIASQISNTQTAQIVELFEELSQIPRTSGEEHEAFMWLMSKFFDAEILWSTKLGLARGLNSEDGQFAVIGLPATGRFIRQKKSQSIALQSHMDRFVDGDEIPQLEIRDGWIQSKNNHASIGADNGVGVALMVYLMLHPEIEHPPLELVFSSREEEGLTGAKNFNWPLDSQALISLDGESSTALYYGSMGSERISFSASVPAEVRSDYSRLFHLSVHNLPSGHSGTEVHLHDPHTASVLIKLLRELPSEVSIVELSMGSLKNLNKLPSGFDVIVYIPEDIDLTALETRLEKKMESTLRSTQSDTTSFRLEPALQAEEIKQLDVENSPSIYAVPSDVLQDFYATVDLSLKGVLEKKTGLPESGLSSANLGHISIEPTKSMAFSKNKEDREKEVIRLQLGFATMIRSFSEDRLRFWVNQQTAITRSSSVAFEHNILNQSPGWLENQDSWLIRLIKKHKPNLCLECAAGGIEVPYFLRQMPEQKSSAAVLGVDIEKAHDRHERVSVASIEKLRQELQTLLISIGTSKEFKKSRHNNCRGVLSSLVKGR